jgi:iron complex outermembrane receptor protein
MFKQMILAAAFAVMILAVSASGALVGKVTDGQTGLPIAGAAVKLIGQDRVVISDTAGGFAFAELPLGRVALVISVIGYEIGKRTFDANQISPLVIALQPKAVKGQDIIVTATRGTKGETPAAFSNLSNDDISKQYWAQDTPMLLNSLPNVFSYSDAGSPIGYSYMKIRGFDQKRISVMLNGIPLNDAESHEVFWVDLPDFTANVQDIQVQRGAGTSLYGSSAMGGAVNLLTNDFPATPLIKAETGYGSYNTRKLSISGNSGLINDSYVFYGRYSKLQTDGYREKSWTNMYAYFLGVARYDANMTLKFNTYGGPEESHLAYKGIDSLTLRLNRRYNELEYANEIDHFNQPHYELIHDWRINDKTDLANTLYYFSGDGYYSQKRNRQDYKEFFPNIIDIKTTDTTLAPRDYYAVDDSDHLKIDSLGRYSLTKVDIVKKRNIKEYDWGWIPRLTFDHGQGILTIGGEMRIHRGHHTGAVTWASIYPQGNGPDVRYYDYKTKSNLVTLYAQETFKLTERLTAVGNLQYQHHNYQLYDEKRFDVGFKRNHDYFSPRAGLNFRFNDNVSFYGNVSTASRPPALSDIYDSQDYWSNPNYKSANFRQVGNGWDFVGKSLVPEKLLDLEVGSNLNYKTEELALSGSINYYWMRIKDELVPYAGQIDDKGEPISGNAKKTLHQGVEFSFDARTSYSISLTGNLSINNDKFSDYKEYGFDYTVWQADTLNRSGNRIGGFPEMLANYRIAYSLKSQMFGNVDFGLEGKFVGKQYIDNGEQFRLDSYHLLNGDISYDLGMLLGLKSFRASLRVNNLADKNYVAAAYMDSPGEPRYMVGATRNFYVSLSAAF